MDAPDVYLNVEATDFFERLAGILVSFAHDLDAHPTDLVMVVDDMTPTMACSIVAKKKGIKVAHLVAGIRSFDMNMPKEVNRMIHMAWQAAEAMGLEPYYLYRQKNMAGNFENVGYAAPGKECLYNVLIMEEKQTILACGAGTTTKVVFPSENRLERVENVKDVGQYIERIGEMLERKEKMLEKLE